MHESHTLGPGSVTVLVDMSNSKQRLSAENPAFVVPQPALKHTIGNLFLMTPETMQLNHMLYVLDTRILRY